MKALLTFSAAALIAAASEPSAFSAGDLSSKNPYGLTQTEKYILDNKNTIDDVRDRVIRLESKVEELRNALDAFRSLTSGGNEKLFDISKEVQKLQSDMKLQQQYQTKVDGDIKTLTNQIAEVDKAAKSRDENIKEAVKQLSGLIDNINDTYVHKNEMKAALERLVKELQPQQSNQTSSSSGQNPYAGKKPEAIFEEAKEDFKARRFTKEAQPALEYLAQNTDYNRGEVMYLLGEIHYQLGRFKEAITAFKSSVKADDKAKYLPVLLFHTGVAYQKLGNESEAKKFYESLIAMYPDSFLVESAQKRLKGL